MNNYGVNNGYGNQLAGGQLSGLAQQGLAHYPAKQTETEYPPRDAAGIVALAEKRIIEIDAQLARVPELQAERERLARIVATKEPSGAT